MSLSKEQLERYARNIVLAEVGKEGQEKLLESRVLQIGLGGLGSAVGFYLAAAGVGTIGIVDSDVVDMSNLQRQILFSTEDLGRPKVDSAEESIRALNSDVNVRPYQERFASDNALDMVKEYDFVIDATDSFASKFLIADACHFAKKPYSHATVLRFDGQMLTVIPGQTTCYRCVFDAPPPEGAVPPCSEVGVLGVLPGVMGTIQVTEAIKYILGIGDLLTDRLLVYDALTMKFRDVAVKRNRDCPLCGEKPCITKLQ